MYIRPMDTSTKIKTSNHCVYALHCHLVFVTKYRRKVFEAKHIAMMKDVFADVCDKFEADLIECNGENDHVHLHVEYPPKHSLSSLVNSLKGVSSRLLRRDYPALKGKTHREHLWSPSYFVGSCGGASLEVLKKYINNQSLISSP